MNLHTYYKKHKASALVLGKPMSTPVYITQIQALILHYMSLINNTRQFRINTLLVDNIYITHKRTCKLFPTYPTLSFNMIHPHSTQIFEWIYTTNYSIWEFSCGVKKWRATPEGPAKPRQTTTKRGSLLYVYSTCQK